MYTSPLKTVSDQKKKKLKQGKHIWFSVFFVLKNVENTKFRLQKQFSENIIKVFYVFSKTFLKNGLQKQEPNRYSLVLAFPHHQPTITGGKIHD